MTSTKQRATNAARRLARTASIAAATLFVTGNALAAGGQTSLAAVEYREGHREAAIARRAELMARMEGGSPSSRARTGLNPTATSFIRTTPSIRTSFF